MAASSPTPEAMDTASPEPPKGVAAAAAATEGDPAKEAHATLLREFAAWQETAEKTIILKESVQDSDDGKTSLQLALDSGQTLTLHCPLHYPNYRIDEDNFFVEADSGLQLWCNALNEYLLDSDGRLTLSAILNKGLSLYSSADQAAAAEASCSSFNSAASNSNSSATAAAAAAATNHTNNTTSDDEEEEEDKRHSDDEDEDMEVYEEDEEDQGQGDDEQLEDILDNDLTWELEIARRKKRWRLKEDELRSEKVKNSDAGIAEEDRTLQQLYHDPSIKNRTPKQVFTSAAASGILTNDLVQIMETVDTTGIEADTVEDNIFQWNVKIRNFSESNLNKDFQELKAKHGYDYIELQLDFSMDLYPFFPPLVKVIRPRLQGSMMLRVTTMEILKLSYWNPARDMKSVLIDIKSFLQTWARLDLQSDRNDRSRYAEGAYIDIEHHLLRLALVSEIVPRANKKYVVSSPPPKAALPPTAMESAGASGVDKKKTQEDKKPKSKFNLFGISKDSKDKDKDDKKKAAIAKNMAKGVGYSSYQQKGWDVKAYMAAQKEKDKQIELVLGKIHQELKKLHGTHQAGPRNPPDLIDGTTGAAALTSAAGGGSSDLTTVEVESRVGNNSTVAAAAARGGSRRKRKHSPDEAAAAAAAGNSLPETDEDGCPIDPLSDLYAVLEGSALVPFLESKLQANSFLEICSHTNVYKCVVNIVREIASQPCLVSLLGPLPDQPSSLHLLLLSLESQARVLLEKIGKAAANGSVPKSGKSTEKITEKTSDDKLARDFLSLSKEVTQALKNTGFLPDINGESSTSASVCSNDVNMSNNSPDNHNADDETDDLSGSPQPGPSGMQQSREEKAADMYKKHMKTLQFDSSEFSLTGSQAHAYASQFQKAGSPSSQVIIRVAQEVSSLSTSLPLDFSSAIFIRSDDDRVTLLRAIITGPEDTPYTGGCYQFDIFFPSKYPQVAPQVNFRTTGGGIVRFNPNLYNCGKVCLSLLGTWEGAQGEQWNETSTILQVLISIQSLILCAEPYYNEPGFERLYGTPQGDQESLRYSEDVFRNNLKYAILGQLQNPPEGFEDVVKSHFYLKRHILIKELEKLLEKYKSKEVKKQFAEVKRELLKLEPPTALKKPT